MVTGAAGFAGGHLVQHLAASGADVVGWARTDPAREVAPSARWDLIDLLDRDAVRVRVRQLTPSAIYHCAGAPHVAHSWENTARPLASNVLATHYLLDAIRLAGAPCRVLIPGSATIYRASAEPISEDHPVHPDSPYALSKLAQEELGRRSTVEDNVEVILPRSFNHTGPRQAASFAAPSIARQLALIEVGRAPAVIHVGNLDARRDLTDVRDTVRAYSLLMERGRTGIPYNVCSGKAYTIRDVLDGLHARVNIDVRIEVETGRLRPNDTPVLVGNPSRLHEATGWSPAITFDRMLDDLLEYWRTEVSRR